MSSDVVRLIRVPYVRHWATANCMAFKCCYKLYLILVICCFLTLKTTESDPHVLCFSEANATDAVQEGGAAGRGFA